MKKVIKHKPETWCKKHGTVIVDPDGWRKDGKSFKAAITEKEFLRRRNLSTVKVWVSND